MAAVAAEMAQMARIIALAGTAGSPTLGFQDIVEIPEMAPVAILGMLSGDRLKLPQNFKKAAGFRRAMSTNDVAKVGSKLTKQLFEANRISWITLLVLATD